LVASLTFAALCIINAAAEAEDADKFCAELTASKTLAWTQSIYYRATDGSIKLLQTGDVLYQHAGPQLFYFIKSDDSAKGKLPCDSIRVKVLETDAASGALPERLFMTASGP
jgi:hypothetical protein